jgi:hypothetical protein
MILATTAKIRAFAGDRLANAGRKAMVSAAGIEPATHALKGSPTQ